MSAAHMVDPDDIMTHIGQRIIQRRRSLGLTCQQVAIAAELSNGMLRRYEKGRASPRATVLFAIAEVLRTDVGYFYEGLPSRYASISNSDPYQPRNELEVKLMKATRECSRMSQDALLIVSCGLAGIEP